MSDHNVYLDNAGVRDVVNVPTGQDDRINEVAIAATIAVRFHLGLEDDPDTPWADVPVEHPAVLTVVPAPAAYTQACRIASARLWAAEAAPFGVLGGLGDLATRPGFLTPELEVVLQGYRQGFPVA